MNKGSTPPGSKSCLQNFWVSVIESFTRRGLRIVPLMHFQEGLTLHLRKNTCYAKFVVKPKWLEQVIQSYEIDEMTKSIIAKLVVDPGVVPNFTYSGGLLRYMTRIWVGADSRFQYQLISTMHSSAIGEHSGVPVTYRRMKQIFAWKEMKSTIQDFVQPCVICQQAKHDRANRPGLLQPMPIPDATWQIISIDFVEGLPLYGNANCILVVVDKFTKYAHFLLLKHP
jgi:hypothetical protein